MRTDRSTLTLAALFVCTLALLLAPVAIAQEHPEHPEHPEEKGEEMMAQEITKEDLSKAIREHVEMVASEHGGTYPLEDPESGETLQLTLEKVHEERLAHTGPHTYFACVDFSSEDDTLYDVDFFMKGKTADDLKFEKFSIHKVNGEPRYTWHEKDGTWMKKKTDMMEGEHEHPEEGHEHPDEPPVR